MVIFNMNRATALSENVRFQLNEPKTPEYASPMAGTLSGPFSLACQPRRNCRAHTGSFHVGGERPHAPQTLGSH